MPPIPPLTSATTADALMQSLCHYVAAQSQQQLLARLFGGNDGQGFPAPPSATPPGFGYAPRPTAERPLKCETLFLSPHPSDVSADFFPLLIHRIRQQGGKVCQLLLTRGEKGDARLSEAETIDLRFEEERNAAQITGINLDYLTRKDGPHGLHDHDFFFPDAALMQHLPELTERLKAHIRSTRPQRIALPALYPDHPDHLATAIAALNACLQLREEGFFRTQPDGHGPIELFTGDAEFAAATGLPWARQATPVEYGGDLSGHPLPPNIGYYPYGYREEDGRILAAADITAPGNLALDWPVTVPPLMLLAPRRAAEAKIEALLQHATQVIDPKAYGHLIPALDLLRSAQLNKPLDGEHWAMGIFPVHIPGVTRERFSLLDAMPDGTVYQLVRQTSAALEASTAISG